jgi:hypothetical protein
MKNISLKALAVGFASALVVSVCFALLVGYWMPNLYSKVASGASATNPLFISFCVVALVLTAGIPGYLAALVAQKRFVLHSMLVGVFVSFLGVTDWNTVVASPLLALVAVALTLATTFLSGEIRTRQVAVNAQ